MGSHSFSVSYGCHGLINNNNCFCIICLSCDNHLVCVGYIQNGAFIAEGKLIMRAHCVLEHDYIHYFNGVFFTNCFDCVCNGNLIYIDLYSVKRPHINGICWPD